MLSLNTMYRLFILTVGNGNYIYSDLKFLGTVIYSNVLIKLTQPV